MTIDSTMSQLELNKKKVLLSQHLPKMSFLKPLKVRWSAACQAQQKRY